MKWEAKLLKLKLPCVKSSGVSLRQEPAKKQGRFLRQEPAKNSKEDNKDNERFPFNELLKIWVNLKKVNALSTPRRTWSGHFTNSNHGAWLETESVPMNIVRLMFYVLRRMKYVICCVNIFLKCTKWMMAQSTLHEV